jgi:hypothetical protein
VVGSQLQLTDDGGAEPVVSVAVKPTVTEEPGAIVALYAAGVTLTWGPDWV